MTTITDLTLGATPMTGAELIPSDQTSGGDTVKFRASDLGELGKLYAALKLGIMADRFDMAGTFLTTQTGGAQLDGWFPPGMQMLSGFGPCGANIAGRGDYYTRPIFDADPSAIYEVDVEVEQVSVGGGETPNAAVYVVGLKLDLTQMDGTYYAMGPVSGPLSAGNVIRLKGRFSIGDFAITSWPAAARFLRFAVAVNYTNGAASVARVRRMTVRNIGQVRDAVLPGITTMAGGVVRAGVLDATFTGGELVVNWDPGLFHKSIVRHLAGTANITGIKALYDGQEITWFNASSDFFFVWLEHPDSLAANRFAGMPECTYIQVQPGDFFEARYDAAASRWRLMGGSRNAFKNVHLDGKSVGNYVTSFDLIDVMDIQTLTFGGSIAWDSLGGVNAEVTLTSGSGTLAAISNPKKGLNYVLDIYAGGYQMAFDSAYKFADGPPELGAGHNQLTARCYSLSPLAFYAALEARD